ncbi:MAG: single-stranded-DNA-specific exonuclease RecJ, partial [Clostridiales bacterium]|nr:single-stranded-DNA-specific exonuclease RecJ [Clostridiales bacterium]
MEQWFIASKRADFNAIAAHFHISPVLARLMRNRDLTTEEEMQRYLYGSLKDMYDPWLLKDVEKGAALIKDKIKTGARIRIISDYDVDGVSSNYILLKSLRRCAAQVDYRIPYRIDAIYPINQHMR